MAAAERPNANGAPDLLGPTEMFSPERAKTDPLTPPSAESGGVPDPSAAYLSQTLEPSTKLDKAQPLLIVCDLNGTLVHRPKQNGDMKQIIRRPFAGPFASYMIKNYWFMFWSSARPSNVRSMASKLLACYHHSHPLAVWDRSKFGFTEEDYKKRTQCYKRLELLWDDPKIAATHPDYENGGRWSQANTVMIDDTVVKARAQPHNLILIPTFEDTGANSDMILPQVHDYINDLAFQSDVSAYMKAHPFRQQPLSKVDSISFAKLYIKDSEDPKGLKKSSKKRSMWEKARKAELAELQISARPNFVSNDIANHNRI